MYAELPSPVAARSRLGAGRARGPHGEEGRCHAFLYRPHNPEFEAPEDERPPLIVSVHGGPTSATVPTLSPGDPVLDDPRVRVVDVNYGGSTGYGRRYRERLDGRGVSSTSRTRRGRAACSPTAARWTGSRVAILGGSAGGYTALCALAFSDVFAAGVNLFGVVDLETFAEDTHKFEARYLDLLVGDYPEQRELYRERSPVATPTGSARRCSRSRASTTASCRRRSRSS